MFKSLFFRRLFIPYLLLICAAVGIVGVLAAERLRDSYLERTRRTISDNSWLIVRLIEDNLRQGRTPELGAQIQRLGQALDCRITVINTDGTVVADNEADPADMENHRLRPEIIAAAANGQGMIQRESDTLQQGMLYFARRIELPAHPPRFLRLAVSLNALDRHLRSLYAGLAAIALLAMAGAGTICYFFARRHAAPLVRLTRFAGELARGDLDQRILKTEAGEIGTLTDALNSMADSLGRLLAQTTHNHAELLAILSSMSEGVIATDMQQRIVLVNAAAADLLDFAAPESQGRRLWEVVRDPAVMHAAAAAVAPVAATAVRQGKPFQIGPIAGRHVEVTVCTFPQDQPPQGLILIVHDATQSVRYQELRKEFVANVSHELRTPLTAIKGFAQTLRDGAMEDPVKGPRFLATIERHADQLTSLVSDLLELSRLESHPDVPRLARVDLDATARHAIHLLMPAAQKKRQNVSIDAAPGLPSVAGNPDYLERAIANLVENAIKYTPPGGAITVSLRALGDRVAVEVDDNGIGIPPEDLPRIFERFYRVDRSRSREMGGTGLGLSIVKHIAQAHRGGVTVISTPGRGSRFTLTLPITDAHESGV